MSRAGLGLATGLSVIGLAACGSQNNAPTNESVRVIDSPAPKVHKLASQAGRTSLDGCNLTLARQQIRDRVIDQKRFTADVPSFDGAPTSAAVQIGKQALVNPIILECKSKPEAIGGLEDPLKTSAHNDYNPVHIYPLKVSSSIGDLPPGMEVTKTTLHFEKDKFKLSLGKNSGYKVVADFKGFAGADGLTYGLVVPLQDAMPMLELNDGAQPPDNSIQPPGAIS